MTDDTPAEDALHGGDIDDGRSSPVRRSLGTVDQSFYIIGVGASAGGLEAIKQMIAQAPDDFAHTLVIIQHMSPDYKSLMSEILSRETRLPVLEVTDDLPLERGTIYLIPPKSNVVIQGTGDDTQPETESADSRSTVGLRFSLVAPTPRPQLNLPIDIFLHSLAEAVGDRSIGIILSGTGTDGSRGLRAIKDRDGFVMVQDPKTASFDGMPQAAIATRIIDVVTTPDAMISELQRYIALREDGVINIDRLFGDAQKEFAEFVALVSNRADIDFSQYKKPTLQRRIARRMAINHFTTVKDYVAYAREQPNELTVLHREFLVGVTNFFRDLPSWIYMRDKVIPRLFESGDEDDIIKVWCVGCSTGEEAYTIAMMMAHHRRDNNLKRDFRVFATDVNAEAIRSAKEGVYPESVIEEIPEEYRGIDFLTFQSGTFGIAKAIRSRVIFTEHNVLEDPPYINTDLIICRNLLIYLSVDMQKKVLALFSFSMRKDGILCLGAAEHVARQSSSFDTEYSSARIYRNARKMQRGLIQSSADRAHALSVSMPRMRRLATRETQRTGTTANAIMQVVLDHVDACVFLIDEGGQVLETFGNYRNFVDLPTQAFSSNIFDLVHDRLKSAISLQVRKVETDGVTSVSGVKCPRGDGVELVDVHCAKISWDAQPAALAVLLRKSDEMAARPANRPAQRADNGDDSGADARILKLESEIESLQEMLSVTAEDLGVSNEELQTTNEDLTVSNEELQANNEEMQSINEELHTVNAENADKILQLEVANADIENLLDTADVAILFLDDDLTIRRYNESFVRYVDLKRTDLGRSLSNFSSSLETDAFALLLDDITRARDDGQEMRRDVRGRDGTWAATRVKPFRDTSGEIDGVVVSIIDTTRLQQLQDEVRVQRDRLAGLLESEAAGYWDWDMPEETIYLSPRFKEMFGYAEDELENTPDGWMRVMHPDDLPKVLEALDAHVKSRGAEPFDNEVRFVHRDGSVLWVQSRGRVVDWAPDGTPLRMLGVNIDITTLKQREQKVYRESEEIRRFAFIAAHDLLQPMNTIERSLDTLTGDLLPDMDGDQAAVVEYLDSATSRMRSRIQGVLDYARFFEEEVDFETVDLTAVARGVIDDLAMRIESVGAEVTLSDLPMAAGKPDLLSRVFQNLIDNAMKYRHPDRPCRISVEPAGAASGMVGFQVIDNGIGIAPEHREAIFKLFSRLHTEKDYEGIGVGLALCDRLIQLHDGTITVQDGRESGTSFVCRLKAAPDA
ncbi:PAS domain-containing protein [Rhodobacterales bacterium HKCCE3408]|nr:PAS domain-containing protein [Rhodobacterales bacterium HKCCE3408]